MEALEALANKLQRKDEIAYVYLFHGYTIVVLKNGTNEVIDMPIDAIEKYLSDYYFFRTHRSVLVNLLKINELEIKNNQLLIKMRGHELPVSRRRKKKLLELLGAVS